MGQSASFSNDSSAEAEQKFVNAKYSRKTLDQLFIKTATKLFKPIELFTLKSNLNLDELNGDHRISKEHLFRLIQLSLDLQVSDILFDMLKFLSYFPNFKLLKYEKGIKAEQSINVFGLIKALTLLSSEKSGELFGNNPKYLLMLLFVSLSYKFEDDDNHEDEEKSKFHEGDPTEASSSQIIPEEKLTSQFSSSTEDDDSYHPDELMDVVLINDKLQWSLIPMIQSYDGIEITQYPMPAARLLQIMTFVLLISSISVDKNDIIPLSRQFDFSSVNLRKHERKAMCLLRSFNLELTSANFNGFSITFATFERIVGTNSSHGTMPNIFIPLHHFLRSILYDPSINNIDPYTNPEFKESRVLSNPMLAQLSTILPADFIFSRLRKLYIGSESGFSMRQMESKIFKWNAPTILFVSGSRIDPESPTSLRNKKFMTFKSEFPRFHTTSKTSQSIPQNDDDNKQQYTYMIFLSKPWKISNSECFGDDTSLIVQLSPRQIVYNANKSCISPNYAYFNTIGGGLGFGSKPPVVKNSVKVYRPGEVSLTVEANMEIGNFRHLNIPGTFCTGSVFQGDRNAPEFETTFQITDIEVWGCGSEKELEEQKKLWEWEHREAEARKRLNVMNWDDGKALLEMAGMIGGAGNSGGSV